MQSLCIFLISLGVNPQIALTSVMDFVFMEIATAGYWPMTGSWLLVRELPVGCAWKPIKTQGKKPGA